MCIRDRPIAVDNTADRGSDSRRRPNELSERVGEKPTVRIHFTVPKVGRLKQRKKEWNEMMRARRKT